MVGEIRDHETADIAIKAAHTGHLVLSTLHTNSAVETLNRLHHLGLAHYQIATSVNLVIAQRLVRKLCVHCKVPIAIEKEFPERIHSNEPATVFRARGCHRCQRGYQGRIGIFELLWIDTTLQNLLVEQASSITLQDYAHTQGMISLRQAGLHKVLQGITSLDEINRILV